ncbi:DUF3515 domain-containing protein [Thermobispora bispora]|uniref:DUF3515 domain-containing protein n=1 Tax=Thermobispora bispora TaxID=2006 RepID=UPI001F11BB10|nr:DUF3515 domain-containing protein [Thermobispora bispora]MDI9580526.1 DUF3515 domain-containing protein [Thermobispora sp.]
MAGTMAVLAALAGCSSTVRVDPPTPSGEAAEACRRLAGVLPATLDGAKRTPSEPASPYVAVWGGGEITLRCGVPRPANMEPTAEVADVNGVGWFQDPSRPLLFTSVNRVAYVEVTISREHAPGNVLVDLAQPIKQAIPE